jgi:hypothetical protein
MKYKANLICIGDGVTSFLVPLLTWLSSMDIVYVEDEAWTPDEVEEKILTLGNTVALVMHPGDFRDGVLHCGPRVSRAVTVASRFGKDWIFLVPFDVDFAIKTAKKLTLRLHHDADGCADVSDGLLVDGLDDMMATSDVRMVLGMLALDNETTAAETTSATAPPTDTTPTT